MEQIQAIQQHAQTLIEAVASLQDVERVRTKVTGKQSQLTQAFRALKSLPPAEKTQVGAALNVAKNYVHDLLKNKEAMLQQEYYQQQMKREAIDVTLPGISRNSAGVHPITATRRKAEAIFQSMGCVIETGPEIEDEYHNFTALNLPELHPSRDLMDTFYIADDLVLRTHTSPVQVRTMESQAPPIQMICPGRVYRCDSDVTHTPMFHQIEGLIVDQGIGFAHLKGCMDTFLQAFFGSSVRSRFRSSYFPFTEPSAEVDVSCVNCDGIGCRVCAHTGWIEILGCGMVNPKVLRMSNIDADKYTGFAFGIGIERLAMLDLHVADIRLLYENERTFLQQFIAE